MQELRNPQEMQELGNAKAKKCNRQGMQKLKSAKAKTCKS